MQINSRLSFDYLTKIYMRGSCTYSIQTKQFKQVSASKLPHKEIFPGNDVLPLFVSMVKQNQRITHINLKGKKTS